MKAAIIANPIKDEGYRTANRAAEILLSAGVQVLAEREALASLPAGVLGASGEELPGADFIVTLGGDGTILAAARGAAGRAPLLGVNMGRKGFLAEVELPHMETALIRAARGEFRVEKRMMLSASVFDPEDRMHSAGLALNDFFLTGVVSPRLIRVEAMVGRNVAGRFAADGVLVSSPTGSTGYSLSAGGPVVSPDVECMVLTPVCAHTLSAVPLVIPPGEVVTLRALDPVKDVRLNADGEERARLSIGWRAEITRAKEEALFVRFDNGDFYGLLRNKLVEWND